MKLFKLFLDASRTFGETIVGTISVTFVTISVTSTNYFKRKIAFCWRAALLDIIKVNGRTTKKNNFYGQL